MLSHNRKVLEQLRTNENIGGFTIMPKYNLPVDKNTVASQMGIQLGGDKTARQNGSVGGEMVRRTFESFGTR